jgi:hypothetical protein
MSKSDKSNPLFELEIWNLVYICDSTGWGVANVYAQNIERDTGKIIKTHNYAIGGLSAVEVLQALHGAPKLLSDVKLKSLREDVAKAEVIVFFANPRGDPSHGGVQGGLEKCITLATDNPPDNFTLELYEPYIKNLKAIYETVFTLRMGKPTIIRAIDFYNPIISEQRKFNMEIECTRSWEIFNMAVHQSADEFNIPIVSVYDVFNGVKHNEDPREKGYICPDGMHTTEKGQQVIADLLSKIGYEPTEK